jgi:predicted transcriptional regulator
MGTIDSDQQKILETLAGLEKPSANKAVAEKTGLDSKVVSKNMKKLKDKGLVDSPVRCKYSITEEGKKELGL